jgi:flagellar biosynthetic protein FlhB
MSEESGFDRTEPASPRRREQAREKGQVARSRELTTLALLLSAGGAMWFMGAGLAGSLTTLMRSGLQLDHALAFDPELMLARLHDASIDMLGAFGPLLGLLALAATASALLVNGWLFTFKPLMPDWNRLDPMQGLARILSWHGLVEMAKAIAKALLVGAVAAWFIWNQGGALLGLAVEPLGAGMEHLLRLVGGGFLVMAGSMALVAAIDVPFQIWDHERKLRMTRAELREENKESEGDPQVKARIRTLQRDMARRRMMAEIPNADVVVTNPTHYAVALRYHGESMRAPRVVAKGAHLLAERIRSLAERHGVPVLEAPPLARALYRHADLGDDIPAALYTAVAEVLAYVYQLRAHRQGKARMPDELRFTALPHGLDPQAGPDPEAGRGAHAGPVPRAGPDAGAGK